MSNFHVGQKVAATIDMPLPGIDKGDVFTIRAVEHGRYYGHDKAVVSVGLHFDEIETPSGCANFDARISALSLSAKPTFPSSLQCSTPNAREFQHDRHHTKNRIHRRRHHPIPTQPIT
jgi:hypothetical protein